jgi:hypothetical protein
MCAIEKVALTLPQCDREFIKVEIKDDIEKDGQLVAWPNVRERPPQEV